MNDLLSLKQIIESVIDNKEFKLPKLPYAETALEPYITAKTLSYHYGKHHKGYVKKLNELVKSTKYEGMTLIDVIMLTEPNAPKVEDTTEIFNNAAQDYNHTFYWESMKQNGGGQPKGQLFDAIINAYSSYKEFKEEFIKAGKGQFGSGWVWLVIESDLDLRIKTTTNADTPIIHKQKPLICCDVWEHAYYLDYENDREKYLKRFLDHLVNWDFAEANFSKIS